MFQLFFTILEEKVEDPDFFSFFDLNLHCSVKPGITPVPLSHLQCRLCTLVSTWLGRKILLHPSQTFSSCLTSMIMLLRWQSRLQAGNLILIWFNTDIKTWWQRCRVVPVKNRRFNLHATLAKYAGNLEWMHPIKQKGCKYENTLKNEIHFWKIHYQKKDHFNTPWSNVSKVTSLSDCSSREFSKRVR